MIILYYAFSSQQWVHVNNVNSWQWNTNDKWLWHTMDNVFTHETSILNWGKSICIYFGKDSIWPILSKERTARTVERTREKQSLVLWATFLFSKNIFTLYYRNRNKNWISSKMNTNHTMLQIHHEEISIRN